MPVAAIVPTFPSIVHIPALQRDILPYIDCGVFLGGKRIAPSIERTAALDSGESKEHEAVGRHVTA